MMKNYILGFLLIFLLLGSFFLGQNNQKFIDIFKSKKTPTQTSESFFHIGDVVKIGELNLELLEAWRVSRPNDKYDLGIITIKFIGSSKCGENENKEACTFYRNKFHLYDSNQQLQNVTSPPSKFILGMQIFALPLSRELTSVSYETGQLFFLLDKQETDFKMVYGDEDGVQKKILVNPKPYKKTDAAKNLRLTPQPKYE